MTGVPQSPHVTIAWDGSGRAGWEKLLAAAPDAPLEQSWLYGDAVAAFPNYQVRRGVISAGGRPAAVIQAFERRVPRLGTMVRVTRGPVWLTPSDDENIRLPALRLIHQQWRLRARCLNLWMPELPAGPASMALMSGCGARRMTTGYSTVRLDLTPAAAELRAKLHGAWRYGLKRAEHNGLRINRARGGPPMEWLIRNYNTHRRKARYAGPPPDLVRSCAQTGREGDVLMLRALAGREPVSGILVLRHGPTATFFIAWSGPLGRHLNAQNLLLWHAVQELKEAGVRWFDLGGVNGQAAPGVARFKLGLGGELHTLAGTFI